MVYLRMSFAMLLGAACLTGMGIAVVRGGQPSPKVEPRPFWVGVGPSHITTSPDDLFTKPEQWKETTAHTDLYKYYGVQLQAEMTWARQVTPGLLARFANDHKIRLECEFGDFRLPLEKNDAVAVAVRALQPIFDAGGTVAFLGLDGPDCRLMISSDKKVSPLSADQFAAEMVRFWKGIRSRYPGMKIGLISNYPNWDWSHELKGFNGHFTSLTGLTAEQVLDRVHKALAEAGDRLDFVEIDNPYNYYCEKKTLKGEPHDGTANLLAVQEWCRKRDVDFFLVVNAEPREEGAKGFRDMTLQYISELSRAGLSPDGFMVQSWYKAPPTFLPETQDLTFMNTARDAISLIRKLYPQPADRNSGDTIQWR